MMVWHKNRITLQPQEPTGHSRIPVTYPFGQEARVCPTGQNNSNWAPDVLWHVCSKKFLASKTYLHQKNICSIKKILVLGGRKEGGERKGREGMREGKEGEGKGREMEIQ